MSYSHLVCLGDMHNLPYKDESFDVIFCSCTLFYSDRPQRAAAEFRRVARPGAIFALMQDVSSTEFLDYSIARWGFPVYDPVSMAYLLFPGGDFQILYSSFCKPNLSMVNGASSAIIVKGI
jgi:ubiquinone/menaquinone biosynthesis C-methylase UbiE